MKEETAGELNAVYKEHINSVLSTSGHLKKLIDDLLDFSIIEIGNLKINLSACPVKEAIDACIQRVVGRADTKCISVHNTDNADSSLSVLADP